ncbi:MAG: protein phosphatase 2C domain-containing protein [Rhodocyclaceae bacterium]|jgi:serine/threonine protein phosphatase PrpC|nr:protein phosphatase 2C domain-containing protein [Rhodocyclaceae bacterium]
MPFNIETCTAQHIGDRSEQQDRVGLFAHPARKGTLLAVLADGMGGHTGGALAAQQVVHSAKTNFETGSLAANDIHATLVAAINDAHDGIKLTRLSSETDPHSTACLLVLQPGRADWAHCGDSRIYHFRDGQRLSRTWDHSHVMNLVKMGYLTEDQAEQHPQKNLLISCLGEEEPPQVACAETVPLADGDCFLLCSDGLWAYFTDEELGRVLKDFPVRQAAEILINTARDRANGRGDNCSLAIVRLQQLEEEKAVPPWKRSAVK